METDAVFLARIEDLISRCYLSNEIIYTDFLDERQVSITLSELEHSGLTFYSFGGHSQARRCMFSMCAQPHAMHEADFPLQILRCSYPKTQTLRHRDFLGAILSTGLERQCLGDILIDHDNSCAYIFVVSRMAEYIMREVSGAGHSTLQWRPMSSNDTLPEISLIPIRCTVASLRLDCVIAAVFHLSRTEAEKLVSSGQVFVNQRQVTKSSTPLKNSDVFSVRGQGKCRLANVSGVSKKGRTIIQMEVFQ